MTLKGKKRKITEQAAEFGTDPSILRYLINRNLPGCIQPFDGLYYDLADGYMLLPYDKDGNWMEDKIFFDTLDKLQKFCSLIGINYHKL